MADMEDLFGSDADSDAERKGGVDWASREGRVAGPLRPDPARSAVPGLRAPRRYVPVVALPPLLPQRPLRSWRCQPPSAVPAFPQRAGVGGGVAHVECAPRDPGSAWSKRGAGQGWRHGALGSCSDLSGAGLRRGRAVCERVEIRCSGAGGMGGRMDGGTDGALLNETRQTVE